jgi:hypothetical protein
MTKPHPETDANETGALQFGVAPEPTPADLRLSLSSLLSRRLSLMRSIGILHERGDEVAEPEEGEEIRANLINELSIGEDLLDRRWD